ncbi:adenylosuccinate synthase [Paenibacillus chondroitinus]|uniref:Adenylosuccinate synthetase n=1 Tax=Paenibacillus chondroitinus TaxID=59842 RepID=A0ABU6DN83_9BACL|nr:MULTISPECIES: adenylosuccinate synthase [Paenibacillus]MCY9663083.1 adenylosuccinate synthase [Paenibacillus anseongense]MEB4799244.1 adenylosuccinate synthase [Paenibacillus chondroitinus]
MTVTAIVGANWGDEGKGKMTDVLSAKSSYVVRYQGGSNAGHTIINNYGKFALHMLPSGVFYPNVMNVIGPGVALDVDAFTREREELLERGVPEPRLCVSDRAQIVLPIHRLLDELEEERLGARSFGSTKRGIAPFYMDKYAKLGIQVSDLYDKQRLLLRLEQSLEAKNVLLENLYGREPIQPEGLLAELLEQGEKLRPFVCDTTTMLHNAYVNGESILLEGQLGALRDPDHGIYPYSTSSSTLAGFAPVGAGLPPYAIKKVMAVVKSYSSCVGTGPFVSELDGIEADELRRLGGDAGEFGATTGRPRRVGWFDVVATRYGCMIQGATEVALTNLDVLGYLDTIPVCVGYELQDGTITADFPVSAKIDKAKPILQQHKGWKCDISKARSFDELPIAAQQYVAFIESAINVPIKYVSVGPRREQLIGI